MNDQDLTTLVLGQK